MGDFIEEYRFYDARDTIVSLPSSSSSSFYLSDSDSDCNRSFNTDSRFDHQFSSGFPCDVWVRSPSSVQERREKFLNWMGLKSGRFASQKFVGVCDDILEADKDRIAVNSGALLRTLGFQDEFCSSRSSVSCWSNDTLVEEGGERNFVCRIGDMDGKRESNVDELRRDSESNGFSEVVLDSSEVFEDTSRGPLRRDTEGGRNPRRVKRKVKKGWLSKLRSFTCIVNKEEDADILNDSMNFTGIHRVKVRQNGKRVKELSALYTGEGIRAHEGPILSMKFSPDGQYLATGGEDGVVRLWQVVVVERSNEVDVPDIDPSCTYFTVNHLSQLSPLVTDKDKASKMKSLRKTSDSACVIFPPKVFRILERPLHEFLGHNSEILDLSWSNSNHLLSSSVDRTVRLWRVGCDNCLKVFFHNDYVTSVGFNPVDDDFFMSGSIDGKVRIWSISSCQVVDWTDIRDIVTAVCYHPGGQAGIVGSMAGNCRFYNISDNQLQLDGQVCLNSKRKLPCKRVTNIQFLPQDPSKVMVTCADSQVRILHGTNVIGKYKGLNNTGNQMFASFTSDGKHIVSAGEDSNVYVWNHTDPGKPAAPQTKSVRSCERFSANASVAIPWHGLTNGNSTSGRHFGLLNPSSINNITSSPACFSLSQEFFLESLPKGSATWPEEKLPSSSSPAPPLVMSRSQYKFLKSSCQSASNSHAWGLVIVTAGWDGRIRSFYNYGLPASI